MIILVKGLQQLPLSFMSYGHRMYCPIKVGATNRKTLEYRVGLNSLSQILNPRDPNFK